MSGARDLWLARAGLIAAALLVVLPPIAASAQVSAAVEARIVRAAQASDPQVQTQPPPRRYGIAYLNESRARADRDIAIRRITAVVTVEIARNPTLHREIVSVAVAAAPSLRPEIIAAAGEDFPGFAPTFAALGPVAPRDRVPVAAVAPEPVAPRPAEPVVPAAGAATGGPSLAETELGEVDEVIPEVAQSPSDDESGFAAEADGGIAEEGINDPLESFNRAVFAFNDGVDFLLLKPVASVYGFILPDVAKRSVRNFYRNLRAPVRLANDILQLEPGDAANTTVRFLINSTVGIGGLIEAADGMGFEHQPADFGQTLHSYGVGSGPYLVLPVLGPSSLRDGVGRGVDIFFDPLTYLLDLFPERVAIAAGEGIVAREAVLEPLDELRESSVDFYATVRSLYFQNRAFDLRKGRPADTSDADDAFEAFE